MHERVGAEWHAAKLTAILAKLVAAADVIHHGTALEIRRRARLIEELNGRRMSGIEELHCTSRKKKMMSRLVASTTRESTIHNARLE